MKIQLNKIKNYVLCILLRLNFICVENLFKYLFENISVNFFKSLSFVFLY